MNSAIRLRRGGGDRAQRKRLVVLGVSALAVSALSVGMFTSGAALAADTPTPGGASIRITEVAYGGKISGSAGDGEYVELTNVGTAPQDFTGWSYTGKDGSAHLPLDDFGLVGPGASVIISDVDAATFRTEWNLDSSVKVIDDKANGYSVTLDKGPDTPTVYDGSGATVDSVSYASGFFSGKGVSAWVDAAHLGAKSDTTGWTISTVGDQEGSWTSASGSVGSPGKTSLAVKTAALRITEVAYGGKIAGATGDGEYVELTNFGTAPQDLTGWKYTSQGQALSAALPLDGLGSIAPGESAIISDVSAAEFQTDWNLPATVKVLNDKANGYSVTLNKGPDTPTIYDATGAVVDSMSYSSTFFSGKGVSAWVDAAHLGAKADTTGWTISTVGDGQNSYTSATGSIGSPGSYAAGVAGGGTTPPDGGTGGTTPPASGLTWPGPQTVSYADQGGIFGQNLSGLFYVAGATPADDFMWGVENGSSSGGSVNTDQSTFYRLVRDANGNWAPASGWEHGVKLHYTDGTGQPDAEGITAVGGKVFISTERDNANNKVSRVAILEFDPTKVDWNAAGGPAINAEAQWELQDGINTDPTNPANMGTADANLGAEAVAFVPDGYLVANGFRTETGALYDPTQYGSHFGGVFLAGIEKNGVLYGFVLGADGTPTRVTSFSSGLASTDNPPFPNSIMDAAWDPSQQALWLDCDNTCQGMTGIAKLNTTAGDPNQGHFQTVTVYNRPTGGPNVNNEGFTFQPLNRCDANGMRSVWWSNDGGDGGYALSTAQTQCTTPIAGQVGAAIAVAYTQQGTSTAAVTSASGAFTTPVTATFTCTDKDAVLQQACPAPVDVTTTQGATSVTTMTDTLGNVYNVGLPAITIARPTSLALSVSPGSPLTLPGDVTLTAVLSGADANSGKTVTFTVDGVEHTATTDGTGTAAYQVNLAAGTHAFGASFAQDASNAAAVATPITGYQVIQPAPTYPSWNSSAKKYAAGARVQYLGVIWEASRDINGQEPGKGKFWIQVEVTSYPLWTSNGKYATGDRVTSNGQVWEASRAINGQKPGVGTFWTLIGNA